MNDIHDGIFKWCIGVELSGEIFYLAKTALLLFVINVVMRQQQGGFNSIFSALSQKSRNATNLSGMLINVKLTGRGTES
ncbi:hypothetical protein [Methylobacter sp. sgz302048]|uniref:hypothetical protein n=1 Tax=Methylobacter sp. sgz302048 TaxID=3455945 RepID=UPI003FA1109E